MAKNTPTRDEVAKIVEMEGEDNCTLGAGKFTLRKEYYWTPKRTPEESFKPQLEKLQAAGFTVTNIEYGDKYASFKGGESLKKNSHYWMKFKAVKQETLGAQQWFRKRNGVLGV